MMLQLIQSPSQRVQRLIEKNCNREQDNGFSGNQEQSAPVLGLSKRRSPDVLGEDASEVNARRSRLVEDEEALEERSHVGDRERDTSESRIKEVSAAVRSDSPDNRRDRDAPRVRQVVDRDGNVVAIASAYSSTSQDDQDYEELDKESGTLEPDDAANEVS